MTGKIDVIVKLKLSVRPCLQWIPPHERARAVSLTTSGMYLGSATGMLVLPTLARAFGAASLLRIVGGGGLAWLLLWLMVGKEVPHRSGNQDFNQSPAEHQDDHKPRHGIIV